MSSRNEYLEKFKAKLDEWNADIDTLETKAQESQAEAQAEYHKQVETLRKMRDDAQKQYNEMQNAATDAWDALAEGTEKAWTAWADAFSDARSRFTSKD